MTFEKQTILHVCNQKYNELYSESNLIFWYNIVLSCFDYFTYTLPYLDKLNTNTNIMYTSTIGNLLDISLSYPKHNFNYA